MLSEKLQSNRKYRFIRKRLTKVYGKQTAKHIVSLAEKHYSHCVMLCKDVTEGEQIHISTVLITTAFYKALCEIDPDNAYETIYGIMMDLCRFGGKLMGGLIKIPCGKTLFMKMLPKMTLKMFGEDRGFKYESFEANKRVLQIRMTACPYCRYAQKLGYYELMPIYCDSDMIVYGRMEGIELHRTQTLGTGGDCCDFKFIRQF